jgi:hypothetical protein
LDLFLLLSHSMRVSPVFRVVPLLCVLAGCSLIEHHPGPRYPFVTPTQRLAAIRRAQVWAPTAVATMDVRSGPQGKGAFAWDATVTCDYVDERLTGASPKFPCVLSGDDRIKVRYGRGNGEIFAGVAATRLLWALGFGADALYPVHVICRGCPANLLADSRTPDGAARFEFAAIERKMHGREIVLPGGASGWAWPELDDVDEASGGAPVAHRDALKLLATMLQHTDNKAVQQKLLCVDDETPRDRLGMCAATFMLIHDVGMTFGSASLMNRASVSSTNLREWSREPVWRDPKRCVGNLRPSQTGSLSDPRISEAGRAFLASLLTQLSDRQLDDLFATARFDEKASADGVSPGSVADWVAAFKHKREEIAAATCPG